MTRTALRRVGSVVLAAVGAAIVPTRSAFADPCPPIEDGHAFPVPWHGQIFETSDSPTTSYTIDWTDRSGAPIGVGSQTLVTNLVNNVTPITGGQFMSQIITAPSFLTTSSGDEQVCDFIQTTHDAPAQPGPRNAPIHTGATNVLSVEAVVLDQATGRYETANIFEALALRAGVGVLVAIPDLYADTNGDGTLDAGDLLYSAVNLNQYLLAVPTFSIGSVFSITNGLVAGLPGMVFSSTPISIDPLTGAFSTTPVTLDATVLSAHVVSATPEPEPLPLVVAGLACVAFAARRRRRA
jgi:hypothetical protein